MIGRLSGEGGGVTLVLAQHPVFMLRCCVVLWWWSGVSPLAHCSCSGSGPWQRGVRIRRYSHGQLVRAPRAHTFPLSLFRLFPQVLIVMPFPLSIRRQPTAYRIQGLGMRN